MADILDKLQEERTNAVVAGDIFGVMASQDTVYVRYGNLYGVPLMHEVNELNNFLVSLGLTNMNINLNDQKLTALTMFMWKFVAVNFKKKAFVSVSDSYDYPVVEAEEFMHAQRGRAASKKFGF